MGALTNTHSSPTFPRLIHALEYRHVLSRSPGGKDFRKSPEVIQKKRLSLNQNAA